MCTVQAIVSANNFGIPIDEKVLDKGFEYLKKCQTREGGFNYRLGDGSNMKEGTAAAVATLGLMQKFDFQVMINGYNFLQKLTPAAISNERFPVLRPFLRHHGHAPPLAGIQGGQDLQQQNASLHCRRTKGPAELAATGRLLAGQGLRGRTGRCRLCDRLRHDRPPGAGQPPQYL